MQEFEPNAPEAASESLASGLGFAGLTEFLGCSAKAGDGGLRPGIRLGDVTIIRLVAEGGMGRVYEGLQGMPCRTVAVKVVRPGVLSPTAAKRFEYEAQILGRLTDPGIARIYSVGMQQLPGGVVPYFVMEYIDDAKSITAYATHRGLSTHDRVTLFREVCRAVAHGHHKGVIHRDLKPGNILVDARGQPKIIDFGVARSTDSDSGLTTMHTDIGQLVGTLQYMCPEQFDSGSNDLDVRADVYSLGIVLYELLAGRLPYDVTRQAAYEVARVVKEVEPQSLSTGNAKLRGDLSTIVAKCLEKDRGGRYSSAAELEADLGRYLRGEAIAASPPRLLDALRRLARRHRLAAALAAGIAAALMLAVVGISIFAVQAERQRKLTDTARLEAIQQAREATDEREAAHREKTRADSEAFQARQRLYVANLRSLQSSLDNRNLRVARQLYTENLAIAGAPLPLEMHCLGTRLDDALVVLDSQKGPVSMVAYSPDGGILAATAMAPPNLLLAKNPIMKKLFRHPWLSYKQSAETSLLFFTAGSPDQYDRLPAGDEEWVRLWRARADVGVSVGKEAVASTRPLAVSADGLAMAMYAVDGSVCIVDRITGQAHATLEGHRGRLTHVEFSPDGVRLATLGANGVLRLWNPGSGRLVFMCGDTGGSAAAFTFSPDGSRIAAIVDSSRNHHEVPVYATSDGRHISTVTTPIALSSHESQVAFSPDGGRLATTSHENELHLWNVADGASIARLQGHTAVITAVALSPDGEQIATGAANGNIRLWNQHTFEFERELIGHDVDVRALAFCPDGKTLASGSQDGTVRIWSRMIAEPLAVLPDLRGMTAAAFSPHGRQLAVAPKGTGDVELWNPRTVERLRTLAGDGDTVAQIVYSPDGSLVAVAFESPQQAGGVRVWRTDTGEDLFTLGTDGAGAVAVAFSPDGSRLLTTSGIEVAMVWDMRSGQRLMSASSGSKISLKMTPAVFGLDGSRVAHKMAHLLDSATGEVVTDLRPQGQVTCLAASPDGRVLATGMAIGTVYLTEFASGKRFAELVGHDTGVRAMAFSPDGTHVATGSHDGIVRLWNAGNGQAIHQYRGHEGCVETALLSPDGRRIITGAMDGTTRIWDVGLGQELCVLPGQRDFPRAVALSPDGTLVVAAASDGAIRIWGLSNADVVGARRAAAAMILSRAVTARP